MNIQGYKYGRSRSIQPFIRGPREEVEKKHLNLLEFKRRKTFKRKKEHFVQDARSGGRRLEGCYFGSGKLSTTKEVPHNLLGTTLRSTILHLDPYSRTSYDMS